MRTSVFAVTALLFLLVRPAHAVDISLSAGDWTVFDGTGTLDNVVETVPGIGATSVLRAQSTEKTAFGFIQANYLSLQQSGSYVRAQLKSGQAFLLNVRVRATNGSDYYLSYASYARPATVESGTVKLTLSGNHKSRIGVYTTYTLDLQRDLTRMLPGVDLDWIRWVAVRGPLNIGRLEVLSTVDYLTSDDDGDLLTGAAEDTLGTNPFLFDTDGDGFADGIESANPCGAPLDAAVPANLTADPDGDGVATRVEMFLGTDCGTPSGVVLPLTYGWEPYDPSSAQPPAASLTNDVDGALIIDHAETLSTDRMVITPPLNGQPAIPGYLELTGEEITFDLKSAEAFRLYVQVQGSNGQRYHLNYAYGGVAGGFPPSSGENYVVFPLGTLGYTFDGSSYTTVSRNLSTDLSTMLPGVTVDKIRLLTIRGRVSIKNVVLGDATGPVFSNLAVSKSPAKSGDALVVTFDTSEALPGNPSVTVGGAPAYHLALTGATYTYGRTLDGSEIGGILTQVSVNGADASGNAGAASIFMETDFDAPIFTNLDPAFPIGTTGSTIIFSVDESETLAAAPTANIGALGTAVYLGKTGSTHSFSFQLWGGEGEGTHPIFVSGADPAGNLGGGMVGSLEVDYHPPLVSAPAVNPGMAKSGDTVTITFSLGEAVPALPLVTVDGLAATFVSQAGNDFTYTYTLTGAEGNGWLPVIARATDTAGNVGFNMAGLLIDAAPIVALTNPADGAAGVTVTTLIRVQFNEDMDGTTIDATSFVVTGGAAVGTVSYDPLTRVAQFELTPPNLLDYDTVYTVTLTTAIEDMGGNPLAASYVFDFRTAALGMASISGALTLPPAWTSPKVIEVTGNHLGTVSGGAYHINVDRRADNFVFTWNDVNGDNLWQAGAEERLIAYDCGSWPGSQLWNTQTSNVSNANISFHKITGSFTAPGAWNVAIVEEVTGNRAVLTGDKYAINFDRGENRHLTIFDDQNLDGIRQPAETAIRHAQDPIGTCFSGLMGLMNFGIRSIAGRVTEPVLPILLDKVASAVNLDGPYSYGAISGPNRDYEVYADIAYGATYVWAFDDANANGAMDPGETRIPVSANPVSLLSGDVTGAFIFRRQISGTVAAAPAGWGRPRVTQVTDGNAVDVPVGGGAYQIWVPARPNLLLYWFNDVNNNYRLDAGEPSLRYPTALNTIYSDLAGINFTGACSISGSFTPPADWAAGYVFARAEAVTYATSFTGPVSGGFYAVGVQPAAAQIRLLAYEDTNRDGLFSADADRHLGYGADFSNVGACALSRSFTVTRTVTGTASVPPGWIAPTVRVSSWTPSSMNTAAVTGGTYTTRVAASTSVSVLLFDDRNGNHKVDAPEQALNYRTTLNTTGASAIANFPARTISGTAGVPLDAVNPKVFTDKVWSSLGGGGSFVLNVNDNTFFVMLFDDLDNDNQIDWMSESIYGYASTNAIAGNVTLNFNLHAIHGRVTPPPTWTNVKVDVNNVQTFGVAADGKYVAYVTDGWQTLRMFEDTNGSGRFDWGEPSVTYPNGVQVAGADVLGINITYPTISGTVQVPPNFVMPLVGVLFGPDGVKPVAPVGAAFTLPAYYGGAQLMIFDDINGTGAWEWGEPMLRHPTFINVTGDVSGIQLIYRTVRGTVAFPPSWSRPGVYAQGGMGPLNGVVNMGSYELYVEPSNFTQVGMYDDLAMQNMFVWSDPAINWPTPLDTTFGDVNNIDLFYRTIAGSVTAGTTAGWLRPRAEAGGSGVGTAAMLSGLNFTLYVSPWAGPYGVGVYDDLDLTGFKSSFEPGRAYHSGLGCPPATVDVSLGDALGLTIDSACAY